MPNIKIKSQPENFDHIDEGKRRIGAKFTLQFESEEGTEDRKIRWLEKTDRPYLSEMKKDKWIDLTTSCASQTIFSEIEDFESGESNFADITDPPSVSFENKAVSRTLEFWITCADDLKIVLLKGIQKIQVDDEGEVTENNLVFEDVVDVDEEQALPAGFYGDL